MRKIYIIVVMLLYALVFAGCGGGGVGAPGSGGNADTGIVIQAATLSVDSPDIDTHIHACSATSFETGLTRTSATLNVTAAPLVPGSTDDPFNGATIQECTITYLKANEDPAAPIIETLTIFPNCPLVNGTSACGVTLMDIERKLRWFDDFSGGTFTPSENPTHYLAVFTCTFMSGFGKAGSFQSELDIWLADFNRC
jgi:hypothetical protein